MVVLDGRVAGDRVQLHQYRAGSTLALVCRQDLKCYAVGHQAVDSGQLACPGHQGAAVAGDGHRQPDPAAGNPAKRRQVNGRSGDLAESARSRACPPDHQGKRDMRQQTLSRFWTRPEPPASKIEIEDKAFQPVESGKAATRLPGLSLIYITPETMDEFQTLNLALFPVVYNPDFYRNVLLNPHLSRLGNTCLFSQTSRPDSRGNIVQIRDYWS